MLLFLYLFTHVARWSCVQAVLPTLGAAELREPELYLKVSANGLLMDGPSIRRWTRKLAIDSNWADSAATRCGQAAEQSQGNQCQT